MPDTAPGTPRPAPPDGPETWTSGRIPALIGSILSSGFRNLMDRRPRQVLLVVVVLTGAGCGLAAVMFHLALLLGERILSGSVARVSSGPLRVLLTLALPAAVGAALSELVPRFSPQAGGGLTLVRKAYAESATLDIRTFIGTFVANVLSLGAGTPLGPEGPTVVLTSSFATLTARVLGLPGRIAKGMIPVGTAAGIAAIFGAPMTGVVFAMEEIMGTASRGVLGSSLLAAVAAAVVERGVLGGGRLLPAAPGSWDDPRELFGFALLGAVCGLVAGVIPRAVPLVDQQFRRLEKHFPRQFRAVRGGIAGLGVGLLGAISSPAIGVGYPSISLWLHGGGTAEESALAFLAKTIGVCLALAAPLVGGVFAPSLFMGASLGAAMGHAGLLLFPHSHIEPAAYALVGMGALFAGFLRTPVSAILIVFELTGDYGLVVPLMLAVALSSVISRRLSRETLVETQLQAAGIETGESAEDPLSGVRVRDAMSEPPVALRLDMTLREAGQFLESTRHPRYPVVDAAGRCVGVFEHQVLDNAVLEGVLDEPVESRMAAANILLPADLSLAEAVLELARAKETRAPVVVSETDPALLGFLSPADILRMRLKRHDEESEPSLGTLA